MDEIDRLLRLGRKDLEAGYPQYARQYFEKVLALDASNQEAIDALARIDGILSRRTATAVEPIQVKPVKPPGKFATTDKAVYGLAGILVLMVVVTVVGIAYIMFIEPRREIAVAPTVAAIGTETPNPTPTHKPLPTPTQKRPVSTPIEPVRKQILLDLVDAQNRGIGDEEAYKEVAKAWYITADAVKAIEAEGEEAYLLQFYEIIGIYEDSSRELALLEQEIFSGFQPAGIQGWNSRFIVVDEMVRQTGERLRGLEVPARYRRGHQELRQASRHLEDVTGALLTGARRQDYLISVNRTCTMDESCHLNMKRVRLELELASECIVRATKKLEQLALPTATLPATASDDGVTAEESAYLAQYDIIVTDYLYSVSELQRYMYADVIAMWATCGGYVRKLQAPPHLESVHQELLQASKHYDRAGALLIEEIDAGNANKLPSPSHDEATLGWECLERATDELEKYAEGKGILAPRTPTPTGTAWREVERWERGELVELDDYYQTQTEYFYIPSNEWRVSWDTQPGENHGEDVFWIRALPASGARGTDIANLIGAHKGMATLHGAGSYRLFILTRQAYRIVVEAKY